MGHSCDTTRQRLLNNDKDYLDYLGSLAGDFRGLSRGFDGVDDNFMDIVDPNARKEFSLLWRLVNKQACNIEKTINNWWKDSSIIDEEITGFIDEDELLNYLEPGETVV